MTVASGLADGIAAAAHRGANEVGGRTLAIMTGGLDVACPARWSWLLERVTRDGCAVGELPCGVATRRWGRAAAERIVAALAALTIVVEANHTAHELGCAYAAQALGRDVAALPGRVTSPASSGALALLLGGAHLVRGPDDALELLSGMGLPRLASVEQAGRGLHPTLRATLEAVGAGRDTPDKLAGSREDSREVLMALTELELMGMLARGDGGRFVARDAHAAPTPHGRSSE